MPIKVTKNFTLSQKFHVIQKLYMQKAPPTIREAILAEMSRGSSPVNGGRWDKPYSKSYIDRMKSKKFQKHSKRPSPVNLKLSGQLYEDLQVIVKSNNKMLVDFKKGNNSDKIAEIHNSTGCYGRIRQILPSEDEDEFNNYITKKMDGVLYSVVNSVIGE